MKKYTLLFTICYLLFAVFGCTDPNTIFKQHTDIEDGNWFLKYEPTFEFEIKDTTQSYTVYYLIRNGTAYPYYNLYIKQFLTDDKNKAINEALNELKVMDETTGKPLGDGMGDLFDHKIVALKNYRFPHAGKYKFKIRQYMRQDPLPQILSVGISIEKSISKN